MKKMKFEQQRRKCNKAMKFRWWVKLATSKLQKNRKWKTSVEGSEKCFQKTEDKVFNIKIM